MQGWSEGGTTAKCQLVPRRPTVKRLRKRVSGKTCPQDSKQAAALWHKSLPESAKESQQMQIHGACLNPSYLSFSLFFTAAHQWVGFAHEDRLGKEVMRDDTQVALEREM